MDADKQSEVSRRRLRGRNLAVLAALFGMVVLVYLITMARLETGTQRALENAEEEQSSEAPVQPGRGGIG